MCIIYISITVQRDETHKVKEHLRRRDIWYLYIYYIYWIRLIFTWVAACHSRLMVGPKAKSVEA